MYSEHVWLFNPNVSCWIDPGKCNSWVSKWSCAYTLEPGLKSSGDLSTISNGLQYMVPTLHLLLHLCFYNERFVEHTQQVSKFYTEKLNFSTFSPWSLLSQGKLLPCALSFRGHTSAQAVISLATSLGCYITNPCYGTQRSRHWRNSAPPKINTKPPSVPMTQGQAKAESFRTLPPGCLFRQGTMLRC